MLHDFVIRSFRHRGLSDLYYKGRGRAVAPALKPRCLRRLDALRSAEKLNDINLPGFNLHKLQGRPTRYAIAVSGPWRITFEWKKGYAIAVDLEQYH